MKHIKLFENLKAVDTISSKAEQLKNTLNSMYTNLIKYIEKDIKMEYEISVAYNGGEYVSGFNISTIKKDGMFDTSEGDEIDFEGLMLESKIIILQNLQGEVEYTYKYQKDIITNEPTRISEIIFNLNPKIKKEYPHLLSGRDLGLLK